MICNRILADAKAQADATIANAKKAAKARVESAKHSIDAENEIQIERAMAKAVAEAKQSELAEKTRARKDELAARQNEIDTVFAMASAKINKAKLGEALKKKFAKPGDKVENHPSGGIVIDNPGWTLSLSLPELLQGLRQEIENTIAELLFT